jgi:hypothetical protein
MNAKREHLEGVPVKNIGLKLVQKKTQNLLKPSA